MESKLESGSFLRQIDEIKQELDFGNDFTEQDYLDEYKPLTDEMDPKFCSDNIEKDILKILNSNETNGKDYSDFCEEMSIRTMRAPSGKLAIVERLGKLLTGKGDRTSSEPANLLGEMEQQGLKDTAAYRKLFEQVDLLKEAEDRLRSLLDLLSQENRLMADHQFDSTKPRDIKLRLVLNESSKRINLDRITNEMLFLERLPKNSIFSTINTSYGFVRTKVSEIKEIRNDLMRFFRKYPKEEFKRLAMRESDEFEASNLEYRKLLLRYGLTSIRDESVENNFWTLETAFKAGMILGRRRRVQVDILEKLYDSVCTSEMADYQMKGELKKRLEVVYRMEKWGKRVKAGAAVNFEDMRKTLQEFKELCPNILVGDAKETIESNIGGIDKIMKKLDQPMFLGELKAIREKMRSAPFGNSKTVTLIDKRIELGEDLFLKLRKLNDQEISKYFDELKLDYDACRVRINKFEEILQSREREEYFTNNIESIMEEECSSLERIRKQKQKIANFTFCRYCEVELYIVNKEVEFLEKEFEMIREGRSFAEARDNFMARHGLSKSDLESIESELQVLRDKIRKEIHNQRMKKSTRRINCDLLQTESDKLQKHLLFLRSLYRDEEDREAIKSGKNSVFEKSLETFLDNYKSTNPTNADKKSKNDVFSRTEDEKRSLVISKLRRMLEKAHIMQVQPADVPYIARSIEQGIYVKLLDKSMYLKVMARIIAVIKEIKKNKYVEIAEYIKKQDYKSKIFLKLSQKPADFLVSLEQKLGIMKDNKRRSTFANKYLAPFEDPAIIGKKIKKRKNQVLAEAAEEDINFSPRIKKKARKPLPDDEEYLPNEAIMATKKVEANTSKLSKGKTSEPFHFFNIFDGNMVMDLNHEKRETSMQLFSCAGRGFIQYFSSIPQKLMLSPRLSKPDFVQYITKALITQQKRYLVLPGFVESTHDLALKSEMENRNVVMSMSYSKKCKVFIFPKDFIQSQWLDILNIIYVKKPSQKVELLFFLVLKLELTINELKIEPISETMNSSLQAYLLKKSLDTLTETELDLKNTKRLQEESSAKALKKRKAIKATLEQAQKKQPRSPLHIQKKFDFDEEIKKINIDPTLPLKKKKDSNPSSFNSSAKKKKSKLLGLFQHEMMTQNKFEALKFDDELGDTALKEAIHIETMKDFDKDNGFAGLSNFGNFEYGDFDGGEEKFEGLFQKHGGSHQIETVDDDFGHNELHKSHFSSEDEHHGNRHQNHSNDFIGIEIGDNGDSGFEGPDFVDSFNAVMDQKMKEFVVDDLDEDQMDSDIQQNRAIDDYQNVGSNHIIDEPFKNLTSSINSIENRFATDGKLTMTTMLDESLLGSQQI